MLRSALLFLALAAALSLVGRQPAAALDGELLLADLRPVNDNVHWARPQREAIDFCKKHGRATGLAIGTYIGHGEYERICLSDQQQRWFDATQAQINATGWGFNDVNSVDWPRAYRAAFGLCKSFDPSFVGGFFTGFMREAPGGPQQ